MLRGAGVIAALALPSVALAYIDPNAGGLLWQILGPVFLMIAMAWSHIRHRLGALYRRLTKGKAKPETPEGQ